MPGRRTIIISVIILVISIFLNPEFLFSLPYLLVSTIRRFIPNEPWTGEYMKEMINYTEQVVKSRDIFEKGKETIGKRAKIKRQTNEEYACAQECYDIYHHAVREWFNLNDVLLSAFYQGQYDRAICPSYGRFMKCLVRCGAQNDTREDMIKTSAPHYYLCVAERKRMEELKPCFYRAEKENDVIKNCVHCLDIIFERTVKYEPPYTYEHYQNLSHIFNQECKMFICHLKCQPKVFDKFCPKKNVMEFIRGFIIAELRRLIDLKMVDPKLLPEACLPFMDEVDLTFAEGKVYYLDEETFDETELDRLPEDTKEKLNSLEKELQKREEYVRDVWKKRKEEKYGKEA